MKKFLLFIFSGLSLCFQAQTKAYDWEYRQLSQTELSNFSVLSQCYGYVRFFYPNPNTKDLDWIKFLMYSVQKIENVNDENQLRSTLNELFLPICPQISFSTDSVVSTIKMTPPYFVMEHKAVGTLAKMEFGKKYSPIVNIKDDRGYQDIYSYKLKDNLYVNFPLAVKELPAKTKELTQLIKTSNKIKTRGNVSLFTALFNRQKIKQKIQQSDIIFKHLDYRIADVMVRRNFIQHFYPYFTEDNLAGKWDEQCLKTMEQVAQISNSNNYYKEICKLLANVKDSHIIIWSDYFIGRYVSSYIPYFYPDIAVDFINDTICYVDFAGKEYENEIKHGDVITAINDIPIKELIRQKLLEIPHSTTARGLYTMSYGGQLMECNNKDSVLTVTLKSADNNEKTVQVKANISDSPYPSENSFIKLLDNNMVYINLCSDSCTYDNFVKKIPDVQNSNGVIFDVRGYPQFACLSIISHFLKEKIELGNILEPVYCFPNHQNVTYNVSEKWYVLPATSPQSKEASKKYEYKEPQPVQIDKPVVFLTNGGAISFAETFMDMMKFHKIGTIVGTPTAGCNGDVTRFDMPMAQFFMTYDKSLNRDGSQHHGIGILPDVYCEMQISDIQHNIDTQLEKAKEILYEMGKTDK